MEEPDKLLETKEIRIVCNIPNLRQFDSDMAKEYEESALPLLPSSRYFLLLDLVFSEN
jgi:hypothetical protein